MKLEARAISRQYPGTLALDKVDFTAHPGEVHGLIGENGAGKSTLVKILAGIETATSGELVCDDPAGVSMIHQELNLLPDMTVADNIFLGRERTRLGVVGLREQQRIAAGLLEQLEQPISPRSLVRELSLGQQQIVEIAKALLGDVRVLIMDEPTSALSPTEVQILFRVIRGLKARGVAIIYISHRLEELLTIGDRITVLRDGRKVAEALAAEVNVTWIVEQMTGRPAHLVDRAEAGQTGAPLLQLQGPGGFTLAAGEICGIYGLLGAGRTELLELLAGLRPADGARILFDGQSVEHLPLRARVRRGLMLLSEDRKASGLLPNFSVRNNITLASLRACTRGYFLSPAREDAAAAAAVQHLQIRAPGIHHSINALSGGNQQKVLLARMLETRPRAMLLDEPSRGVDVGARAEIFALIRRLAGQGMAILFTSSDTQEVLSLAHRVLVMASGRITADLAGPDATPESLVRAAGVTHARA